MDKKALSNCLKGRSKILLGSTRIILKINNNKSGVWTTLNLTEFDLYLQWTIADKTMIFSKAFAL